MVDIMNSLKIPKGNQNLYIEDEQTIQWPQKTDKRTDDNLQNITHKTKDRVTRIPLKQGL